MPFSPCQHIFNCLDTYSLKTDSNVQKFNDGLNVYHCTISKFCSLKQETEIFDPLEQCDEGDGLVAVKVLLPNYGLIEICVIVDVWCCCFPLSV